VLRGLYGSEKLGVFQKADLRGGFNKKPLLKEEVRYNNYFTSHLPDLTLPELAPGF
jgi:hypothetical protein